MIHVLVINQHLQSSADVEQRCCADAENSEQEKKRRRGIKVGGKAECITTIIDVC